MERRRIVWSIFEHLRVLPSKDWRLIEKFRTVKIDLSGWMRIESWNGKSKFFFHHVVNIKVVWRVLMWLKLPTFVNLNLFFTAQTYKTRIPVFIFPFYLTIVRTTLIQVHLQSTIFTPHSPHSSFGNQHRVKKTTSTSREHQSKVFWIFLILFPSLHYVAFFFHSIVHVISTTMKGEE